MQKRTIAILLLLVGIILILGVFAWLFLGNQKTSQPPPIQPSPTIRTSPPVPTAPSATSTSTVLQSEQQLQDMLKRQASDLASRMSSYSSLDEFAGMKSVYVNVTPAVQTFLESERQRLIAAHPAIGPNWGQTSRALTSKITSKLPIGTQSTVQLAVQVQQTIEDRSKTNVQYAEMNITLQLQDKIWIVSHVSAKPIEL